MLNIFSLVLFTVFLTSSALAVWVLRISRRSDLTLTYALCCICSAIWCLGYAFLLSETNQDMRWFWYRFSAFGWVFLPSAGIHFSLAFTEHHKAVRSPVVLALLYLFRFLILFFALNGTVVAQDFVSGPWGTIQQNATRTPMFWILQLWAIGLALLRIYLFAAYRRNLAPGSILARQTSIFLISDLAVMAAVLTINIFIPALHLAPLPSIGAVALIGYNIAGFHSIQAHKLFSWNLYLAAPGGNQKLNIGLSEDLFRFEDLFDSLGAGITLMDSNYRIIRMNSTAVRLAFNHDLLQPQGKPCYHCLYGLNAPCPHCPVPPQALGRSNQTMFNPERNLWIERHTFPLSLAHGTLRGIAEITFDVSEKMRSAKLREDMERMLQHDLRNGLTAIMGAGNMLKDEALPPGTLPYVEMVQQSARTMNLQITASLDLFKMEAGQFSPSTSRIFLPKTIRMVQKRLATLFESRQVTLFLNLPDAEPPAEIEASEPHMEIMLGNLLKNAVEASRPGQVVTLSLRKTGTHILLSIHNPEAVPDEVRGRFFEKYTSAGKEQAAGLGAYTAYLICRSHRGTITMHSSEQTGTTVEVCLPTQPGMEQPVPG